MIVSMNSTDEADDFDINKGKARVKHARLSEPTEASFPDVIVDDDLLMRAKWLVAALPPEDDTDHDTAESLEDPVSSSALDMLVAQIVRQGEVETTGRSKEDFYGEVSLASKRLANAIVKYLRMEISNNNTRKDFLAAMLNARTPSVRVLAIEELAKAHDVSITQLFESRLKREHSRMISAMLRASLRGRE